MGRAPKTTKSNLDSCRDGLVIPHRTSIPKSKPTPLQVLLFGRGNEMMTYDEIMRAMRPEFAKLDFELKGSQETVGAMRTAFDKLQKRLKKATASKKKGRELSKVEIEKRKNMIQRNIDQGKLVLKEVQKQNLLKAKIQHMHRCIETRKVKPPVVRATPTLRPKRKYLLRETGKYYTLNFDGYFLELA